MKPLSILGVAWALSAADVVGAPAPTGDTDNPYSQFDPDGVPLAIAQPSMRKRGGPTEADMQNARKREEQAVVDSNWLLSAYEEQLRLHNGPASASTTDLYLKLSMNKDLAKLAGLPVTPSDPDQAQPSTEEKPKARPLAALRPAPESDSLFKPFITPLSSTALGSTFTASTLFSQDSLLGFNNSAPVHPKPRAPRVSADTTEMDTPGAVADRDAVPEPPAADLTLDLLPGESVEHARAAAEANGQPAVLMNADQLHLQQSAQLKPALPKNAKPAAKVAEQPPVAKPVPPDELPMTVGQGAQVTPVHAPIANPFDILNR
jgi:hypothetical protein